MTMCSEAARRAAARLAVAALLGTVAAAPGVAGEGARATDPQSLRARPQSFAGQTVRLAPAYCGTGGQEGKEPRLYQCAIGSGTIYVESRAVVLSRAARIRMAGCGGLDVWERSAFCRSSVAFVVGPYRPAPEIDAGGHVILFSADRLVID